MTHQHMHHHRQRQIVNNHYNDQLNEHSSQTVNRTFHTNGDSLDYYDQQSNIHFHHRSNHHHNRVPAPCTSNLHPVDSPSNTPRRRRDDYDENDGFITVSKSKKRKQINTSSRNDDDPADSNQQQNQHNSRSSLSPRQFHSNHPPHPYPTRYQQSQLMQQMSPTRSSRNALGNTSNIDDNRQVSSPQQQPQQFSISTAATRYAQTRYPFSPFIIRFSSGSVKEKQVAEELVQHFKNNHQIDLLLTNVRQSTMKCIQQEYDFLIYVKNANSFCALYLQHNWPHHVGGQRFTFLSSPSFPAQLSLVVRNVDLRMNLNDFTDELKNKYPEIHNVIRLKNKFQNEIKMLKIEILSTTVREELLNERRIKVIGMVYDIDEYLSPAEGVRV